MNHHFKHTHLVPEDDGPDEFLPDINDYPDEEVFDPEGLNKPYRITGEAFMIDVETELTNNKPYGTN